MSWINMLFHPIRFSRELNELRSLLSQHEEYSDAVENDIKNLKTDYDKLQLELSQTIQENYRLNQTITLLTSQLTDTRKELSQTRLELQSAEEDLKITEELELLFSQCQEKINRYELRIKKLNSSLKQAKNIIKSGTSAQEYNEITPINSTTIAVTQKETGTQTFPQPYNYSNTDNTTVNIGNNKNANKTDKSNTANKTSNDLSNDKSKSAKSIEENTTEKISFGETPSIDDWLRPLPDDII